MIQPLRHYADFRGRSRRAEFWLFVLFVVAGCALLTLLDAGLGLGGVVERVWRTGGGSVLGAMQWRGGWLTLLFWLAMLIPSLAVTVRRLHDADRSGAWLLLLALPGIGWLVLLAFCLQRTWPVANRWGPPANGAIAG